MFMFARLAPARSASRQRVRGLGGAEADEQPAIVVDDVIDGQADQAGVLATATTTTSSASSASPRRRTGPQHTRPQWPGRARYPGPGPAATYPARPGPGSGPPNRGR